jgi:hypothetical protein
MGSAPARSPEHFEKMPEPMFAGSGGTTLRSARASALGRTSSEDGLYDRRFGVGSCIPERCEPSGARVTLAEHGNEKARKIIAATLHQTAEIARERESTLLDPPRATTSRPKLRFVYDALG